MLNEGEGEKERVSSIEEKVERGKEVGKQLIADKKSCQRQERADKNREEKRSLPLKVYNVKFVERVGGAT